MFQKYFFNHYPKNIAESICDLEAEVKKESFTAWSFANKDYAVSAFWADEYNCKEGFAQSGCHPIFDLASLTKPLFINLFLMIQEEKNYLDFITSSLNDLLDFKNQKPDLLGQFIIKNSDLSLDSFLSHKTGLMPWSWMGHSNNSHTKITDFILNNKALQEKNEIYSDLNYFLLARIIEFFSLNEDKKFSWRKILNKINSKLSTHFFHVSIEPYKTSIPFFPYISTDKGTDLKKHNFGHVHDTNANILSSYGKNNIVSGHAGFFGNVNDIIKAIYYLNHNEIFGIFHKEKLKKNSRFIFGYDTPSSPESSAGIRNFQENENKIFGHLGYSGTAFWVHSERKEFQILLTNRTSARKTIKKISCPRIFVTEDLSKNEKNFYLENEGEIIKKSAEDIINITNNFCEKSIILWDDNNIKLVKDILYIRRKTGLNLWEF